MYDDELPLAFGQPPHFAKMTTLHEDITYRLQVALDSNEYSFRSAEKNGERTYAVMKEKNGRFSIVFGLSEKDIEGRSQEEVVSLIIKHMEIQQSVKGGCTVICVIVVFLGLILLEMDRALGWLLDFTPIPAFIYRLFLFIGIIATIYVGLSRTFSRALAVEERT